MAVMASAAMRTMPPRLSRKGKAAVIRKESIEPFRYSIAPRIPFIRAPATFEAAAPSPKASLTSSQLVP